MRFFRNRQSISIINGSARGFNNLITFISSLVRSDKFSPLTVLDIPIYKNLAVNTRKTKATATWTKSPHCKAVAVALDFVILNYCFFH